MKDLIAICGLDCETCDARIATMTDDDALRERTAKLWSEMNHAPITPEMINCEGCRVDGVKTPFCEALCPIRQCALGKGFATCGHCPDMETCETVGMFHNSDPVAKKRLTGQHMNEMVRIELLSSRNFDERSLDDYKRTHRVERVYRKVDGEYKLVFLPYIEDWDIERKRQIARSLMSERYITYVAVDKEKVVGFIGLIKKLHGERMILDMMHVSAEYRGNGLGKRLFEKGMDTAREYGAAELYISACSSEETVAFYKAMGASLTTRPIESIANQEPYDLQMTCTL